MLRERLQERGYRRCARNPQKKTCPHFLRTHHHRWSKQGFSGSHTFTYLSAQEKSHRPKGNLLSHHVETDQGTYFHCFGWDAGLEFNHLPTGPNKDKHLPTAVCPTSLAPCLSPLGRKSLKTTTPSSLPLSLPPSLLRSHFGSSHFLFKRSQWFSRRNKCTQRLCDSSYHTSRTPGRLWTLVLCHLCSYPSTCLCPCLSRLCQQSHHQRPWHRLAPRYRENHLPNALHRCSSSAAACTPWCACTAPRRCTPLVRRSAVTAVVSSQVHSEAKHWPSRHHPEHGPSFARTVWHATSSPAVVTNNFLTWTWPSEYPRSLTNLASTSLDRKPPRVVDTPLSVTWFNLLHDHLCVVSSRECQDEIQLLTASPRISTVRLRHRRSQSFNLWQIRRIRSVQQTQRSLEHELPWTKLWCVSALQQRDLFEDSCVQPWCHVTVNVNHGCLLPWIVTHRTMLPCKMPSEGLVM